MRTSREELHDDAVEALLDALKEAGLSASRGGEADFILRGPAGTLIVEVEAMSVGDAPRVQALLQRKTGAPDSAHMVVLVADQLADDAKKLLRNTDWGYLDRRGALWMRGPGMIVNDTSLTPLDRRRAHAQGAIRGRVALGVAVFLLMHPHERPTVRDIAGVLGASPSTVHDALTRLREHALISGSGAPLIPDLFNATAAVWRPARIPVRRQPTPDDDLELGLGLGLGLDQQAGDIAAQGWVVSGDVGAAAMGARIVVGSAAPPDFYIPTAALVRRAVRRLGECSYDDRGATVASAPTPAVTAENYYVGSHRTPWLHWPIAHPVVIALDLAQDISRGREIIDDWTPHGFDRVW